MRLRPLSKEQTCLHQQVVDELIVMGEASVKNARNIKKALEDCGHAMRHIINWNKISIFSINVNVKRQAKIQRIMGCEVGILLESYLGLPLYLDPPKSFWSSLIDKIHTKLAGW